MLGVRRREPTFLRGIADPVANRNHRPWHSFATANKKRLDTGTQTVNCSELAVKLQNLNPTASPSHIARQCLMLINSVEEASKLDTTEVFDSVFADTRLQFQAATDQHAAMTQELEELASSDPREFTPDQIWILVRAIKVQSQVLRLYAGSSAPTIS